MNKLIKTMSWDEMQKHKLVDPAAAFQDLTWVDIIAVFELGEYSCENNVVETVISESANLVTVMMIVE